MSGQNKNFVISVYCPVGGMGVSLIASQLVQQLAKLKTSCLLDLNLDCCVSLYYLNLEPLKDFRKAAMSGDESIRLSNFAIKVREKFFALGAPLIGYGQFAEDMQGSMKELFEQCRSEFECTVVDLPHPFHAELCKTAISMSDLVIVLVGNTTYSADAIIQLKKLLSESKPTVDAKKIVYVVNSKFEHPPFPLMLKGTVLIALLTVMKLYWTYLLANQAVLAIFVLALVLQSARTGMAAKSRFSGAGKSAVTTLSKNDISIFHTFPFDGTSCKYAINKGTLLPEDKAMSKSMTQFVEKIQTKLSSGS
ncbi:MAG: hypothetical protein K2X81_16465 [Candidatus Obscuribacterales bacterium]|nr:hypothetical protein [Candidatus Obscuribacterales bacterium]